MSKSKARVVVLLGGSISTDSEESLGHARGVVLRPISFSSVVKIFRSRVHSWAECVKVTRQVRRIDLKFYSEAWSYGFQPRTVEFL